MALAMSGFLLGLFSSQAFNGEIQWGVCLFFYEILDEVAAGISKLKTFISDVAEQKHVCLDILCLFSSSAQDCLKWADAKLDERASKQI